MNTLLPVIPSVFELQHIFAVRTLPVASLLAPEQVSALSKCRGGQVFHRHTVFHRRRGGERTRQAVLAIQPYPRIYPPRGGPQP